MLAVFFLGREEVSKRLHSVASALPPGPEKKQHDLPLPLRPRPPVPPARSRRLTIAHVKSPRRAFEIAFVYSQQGEQPPVSERD